MNDYTHLEALSYTEFYVEFLDPLFTELCVVHHVKNVSITNVEVTHYFTGIIILHQFSLQLQMYNQNFHLLAWLYIFQNFGKINWKWNKDFSFKSIMLSLLVLEDFPAGARFKLISRLLRKVLCNHKSGDDRTLFSRSCLIIGLAHFQFTRDAVLTIASREFKLFKILYYVIKMQQNSRGTEKLIISLTSNKVILAYAFSILILWSNVVHSAIT